MTAVMTSTQVAVDRVRPDDGAALAAMYARCSVDTKFGRFFTGMPQLPRKYVEGAFAGPPARHDALVLRYGDGRRIAGLASFVADPSSAVPTGELGVLIQDGWQGRGYGTELVARLLERAAARGVEEVVASVLPERTGFVRSLARRFELISFTDEDDYLTARYRIGLGGSLANS
jgi:RimJ/RimL family protein N-acetyltransferase